MKRWDLNCRALMCLVIFGNACGGAAPTQQTKTESSLAIDEPSIVVTPAMGHPHVGETAPDFELPDQHGNLIRLSSLRGSVVVLSFAASWCPFSTAAQSHIEQLAKDYVGKNVHVLVVDIEETDEGYRKYLDRMEMTMPVLRDPKGEKVAGSYAPQNTHPNITDRWKVIISSNLVIDPDGQIQFFTLADTFHYDAELLHVRRMVEKLLGQKA